MTSQQNYLSVSRYDNHTNEQYMPLYLDNVVYGSAWVCRTCIIGPSSRRYFTKVKYKLPKDSFYRYQGFYQSMLDTDYYGTWLPFDGIVCALDTETDTIIKNKIVHVSKTFSAQNIEKHKQSDVSSDVKDLASIASWFGTPLFVIISMHMKRLNPTREKGLWGNSKNCSIILKLLGSKFLCKKELIAPEYTFIFLKFPQLKTTEMINRFLAASISRNWLYNLPSNLSSFENEYNMYPFFLLDLNDILNKDEREFPSLSNRSKLKTFGHIDLPNGKTVIPEYILFTDPVQWKTRRERMIKYVMRTKWGRYSVPKTQSAYTDKEITRKRSLKNLLKGSSSKKGRNILNSIIQDKYEPQSTVSSSRATNTM